MNVVKRLFALEYWSGSNVFYMQVWGGAEVPKVFIYGGISIDIVSKVVIDKLKMLCEKHPHHFQGCVRK